MSSDVPTISPILLAGGSGTRLWPLSRKSYPKQFAPLIGDETLFQASAKRLSGQSEVLNFDPPVVVTNSDFRFIATEQLTHIGIDPGAILIEPEGRNTGPAILAAAQYLFDQNPDAIMLVAPSDHIVPDAAAFHRAVLQGLEAVTAGDLVTFGIKPTYPETGYGYLELADAETPQKGSVKLANFVEKPEGEKAKAMCEAGNFLWNAGIFLFAAKDIIAAFEAHAQLMLEPVQQAVQQAKTDLGFLRLDPKAWGKTPADSIDYAVMEKASNISVVPFDAGWSDLGGWDAVWREMSHSDDGNATSGAATAINCSNSLLRSESDGLALVGIGLDNVMAVAMDDAVLVADMSKAQDVKLAVDALKAQKASQATQFPKDHRPWGWFESLVVGNRFQVKRIHVHVGAKLSLQSHVHRSEHWVVVEGTAQVTVDDEIKLLSENQSVYIPLGAVHRLENVGRVPMVLIEIQTGSYVGEDDIVRYEDLYARG